MSSWSTAVAGSGSATRRASWASTGSSPTCGSWAPEGPGSRRPGRQRVLRGVLAVLRGPVGRVAGDAAVPAPFPEGLLRLLVGVGPCVIEGRPVGTMTTVTAQDQLM